MKKILLIIIILTFLFYPISTWSASNTHSMDFEKDSSQSAYAADSADLSQTGDMSFETWVKLDELPPEAPTDYYFASKSGGAGQRSYIFVLQGNHKLRAMWRKTDSIFTYNDSDDVAFDGDDVGVWVHVAMTIDVSAKDAVLYKDGEVVASTARHIGGGADAIHDSNANFEIAANNAANYTDGLMDDIRIWTGILTQAEIQNNDDTQLNNANKTRSVAVIKGYWMLNDNAEDKGEDFDPAGSDSDDLTLVNTPPYSTDVPFGAAPPAVEVHKRDLIID